MTLTQHLHGGPDALGVPLFDFSTNSNACGPCPMAWVAVQQADASRYPDASYTSLRAQLAAFHDVEVQRVLLAASASEFIFRITACVAQQGGHRVWLPPHGYGDYAQAAHVWGLSQTSQPGDAQLVWACEPSSPQREAQISWFGVGAATVVLDRAYEPLRLSGGSGPSSEQLDRVWQLWTPNKALGLTGVRAAYAIAPKDSASTAAAVHSMCASWPVGSHGVAMLQAWVQPEVQAWVNESLHTLRAWKTQQIAMLRTLGWTCLGSDTPHFFCLPRVGYRPTADEGIEPGDAGLDDGPSHLTLHLKHLRAAGVKLRDAASFGLAGHVRVSVQAPAAQQALKLAWLSLDAGLVRQRDEVATSTAVQGMT